MDVAVEKRIGAIRGFKSGYLKHWIQTLDPESVQSVESVVDLSAVSTPGSAEPPRSGWEHFGKTLSTPSGVGHDGGAQATGEGQDQAESHL